MSKFFVLWLVASLMGVSQAIHAEMMGPDALVRSIAQDVLLVVGQENGTSEADKGSILKLVDAKVLPHFDFVRMTRLAVGKNWRHATPEQQQRLVAEFRNLLVNTYANVFSSFRNQTVEVMPVEIRPGVDEVTVKTLILKPGAQRITVNYEMERTSNGWKVFDLTVEGASLINNYRSTFTVQVRQAGIDGLIKTLADKNAANSIAR